MNPSIYLSIRDILLYIYAYKYVPHRLIEQVFDCRRHLGEETSEGDWHNGMEWMDGWMVEFIYYFIKSTVVVLVVVSKHQLA